MFDPATDPDVRFTLGLYRSGGLEAFDRQIYGVGGCEHPVWLRGETVTRAVVTGEVLARVTSAGTPLGAVPVRCMNRRASRCRPCAYLYKGDTFQLVYVGLAGGKGVPVDVAERPRVFVTLTAPSFGPVHRAPDVRHPAFVCQVPDDDPEVCPHGVALTCRVRHTPHDPLIGSPLCADCYDYPGQVLWNAYASKLWNALMVTVYHRLAALSGQPRKQVRRLVRVEYVRNAEYQARGVVHFHAVLRLDGPEGPAQAPPSWATGDALCAAVKSAAQTVAVRVPESAAVGEQVVRFGTEIDARVIGGGEAASAQLVAAYLAKYVSKSTEDAHGVDSKITHASHIDLRVGNPHTRALMFTAWRLGGLREFERLRLRPWCHMLGYRGHNTTASRSYSLTRERLARIRQQYVLDRLREQHGTPVLSEETIREAQWQFAFTGYPSQAADRYAAGIREHLEFSRDAARDAAARERAEQYERASAVPDDVSR